MTTRGLSIGEVLRDALSTTMLPTDIDELRRIVRGIQAAMRRFE